MGLIADLKELQLFENSAARWLGSLAVLVGVLLVLRLSRSIIVRRLSRLAERTQTTLDDLLARLVQQTRWFTLFAVAFYVAAHVVVRSERAGRIIEKGILIVLLLQAGIWGSHVCRYLARHYLSPQSESEDQGMSQTAVSFIGRLALWSLVLVLGLENLGFDTTALITGLGIGGVAIALAVQNILGDVLASLSILLDRPFVVGDFIVVGDFLGTVEHIGIKTTRARSVDGEQIVFANSDLLRSRLRNYHHLAQRRSVTSLRVTPETDPDQLERIPTLLREIVSAQPSTRFERAHLKELGACSLDFEMVYWMEDPDYLLFMDTQQQINLDILRRFRAEGIELAYPTQRLFIQPPPAVGKDSVP